MSCSGRTRSLEWHTLRVDFQGSDFAVRFDDFTSGSTSSYERGGNSMRARFVNRGRISLGLWVVLLCLVNHPDAMAQATPSGPLTLGDAIQTALTNYPAIKERRARAEAADASIAVARTAYLPRLDMIWQENR